MKLTITELQNKEACIEGIELFERFFPEGFDLSKLTLEYQIKILTKTRLKQYWGWAVGNRLIPALSMNDANLTGANLTGADLTGAYLYRANLTGANLTGAYLIGADLYRANLTSANLTGADLTGTGITRKSSMDFNCTFGEDTLFDD